MMTTAEHTTETISGKEFPLTVTRERGYQEVEVHGERIAVEAVTVFDSPLGRSRCFTRVTPAAPEAVRAANRRRVQEVAAQAILDQGLW